MLEQLKNIDGKTILDAIHSKEIDRTKLKERSRKEIQDMRETTLEVDLHIHELVENESGLEPNEKLEIQLNHFEERLNEAIKDKLRKVVFIHGVGNGVLKMKIRNILDRKYSKLRYQDASFEKYKFGATLVNL
ncbi:MAG: Smr/MutS family protein [Bacteroidales bacterium]|nr:Smr/MutS family protein [Bacteroidales bacterium]